MQAGKITLKQKVLLLTVGICLTLLLLEIGLRAGGMFLAFQQEQRNQRGLKQRDVYRIVCLGESMTANGGENAYPYLLEKILNRLDLGVTFKVINKGMPGSTSPEIVMHLNDMLDQYQPQMAIVMLGINDTGDVLPYQNNRRDRLSVFLKSLRVYKLACLLKEHIKVKIAQNQKGERHQPASIADGKRDAVFDKDSLDQTADLLIQAAIRYVYHNQIPVALNMFEKASRLDSAHQSEAYAYWGWGYRMDKQLDKAKEVLNKAIELDPKNSFAYQELGQCYSMENRHDLYKEMLHKAIEADSQDALAYQRLALFYMLEGESQLSKPLLEKALNLKRDDDRFLGRLGSFYMGRGDFGKAQELFRMADQTRLDNFNMRTKESYKKVKDSVLARGMKLVCVQYPVRGVEALKKILDYDPRVIFVDNEGEFKAAVQKVGYTDYFEDMFAGDFGHCTPKGNALLAGNIARELVRTVFLR